MLEDNSLDLVVTSPPYNVGIKYDSIDDSKQWADYRNWIKEVISTVFLKLKEGGRVVWNIASYSSLKNWYKLFVDLFEECGFKQYAEIIWDKKQISSRTAWGSFKSASQPNILPRHEYVLVFYKGVKNHGKGKNNITNQEFVKWTDGMWEIRPETNSSHPAPFPVELAIRAIKMFSHIGDIVLDPFMGSGTTAIACQRTDRKFIGFEISQEYVNVANRRIAQITLNVTKTEVFEAEALRAPPKPEGSGIRAGDIL